MDLTGGFKIADDSSSWDTQFIAETGGALAAPMTVGTVYDAFARFAGDGTDPGNNTIALDSSSNYLFRLKLDTTATMSGSGVKGTIDVCQLTQ